MRATDSAANTNSEYAQGALTEKSEKNFIRQADSEQIESFCMNDIEHKLKAMWSEYVEHQEKHGLNEKTRALKEKYFSLYRSYRRNKKWKQIVSNNQ